MPDHEGRQLGNYQLIRLLGQGGFAHVYLGEHVYLKTLAAVKVLDVRVVSNEDSERFLQEARTIAELRHPNIIRVLDFAVVNDVPFLVMDYAPNDTLARLHPRGRPLPLEIVVIYVKQVAAALQYAHDRKKLIHCDVKPANMLLGANNEVLLSDFGIALTSPSTSRALTIEQIIGTLAYMAPEHLSGRPVLASDQYSLGIVVYEWLSGDLPFSGSQIELFSRHNFAQPPSLAGKVPPLVEQVVLRALAKLPYQRYPRVQDFADALEDAVRRSNQPSGPLVLGLSGPLAAFNRVSPSTATQQATVGAFPPAPAPVSPPAPTLFPPAPPQTPPLPPINAGQTTLPEQAFTPSAPLVPGSPPLPEHPLVQREHTLIREVYGVVREYEGRKAEAQRVYEEEERAASREQQVSLGQADKEVDALRLRMQETLRGLADNNWERWAKMNVPVLQAMLKSPPLAIAPQSTPAEQLSFCTSTVDEASRSIETFLGRYMAPERLFKRNLYPAGALAVLCFVITGALCGFSQNLVLAFGVALVAFGATWLGLSLLQLKPMRAAYARLEQVRPILERISQAQHALIDEAHQRRLSDAQDRRRDTSTQLEQTWQWHLNRLRALFTAFMNDLGFAAATWNDPLWDTWQPVNSTPPVARIGGLTFPDLPGFPLLPALLSCPAGCNLFIKARGPGRMPALAAVQALALRLLATQSPGKVHLTLIDPVGLGRYVDAFLRLAEHHEMLGTGRVWVDDQEIEQQLRILTQHIRRITQEHSRSQYLSTQEFNRRLGESDEPYHVLIIVGFPASFSARAANDLLTIAQNGPRCGVSTLILADLDRPLGPLLSGFDPRVLESMSNVLTWDGQRFAWQDADLQGCQLELDTPPPQPQFNHLLQEIAHQAAISSSIEQNTLLSTALASPAWQGTREPARIWLGHPIVAKEPTAISLRRESGSNLLIIGQQEEAAVNLLTSAIVSLAAQLPPERLQCYVLDLSTIYESAANPFELLRQLLPRHVRQVLSRRHLRTGLAPLITTINDSVEARRAADEAHETSIYFILCGLQRLDDLRQPDNAHDAQAGSIAQQFTHILRRGSDLGVHTLAWCDKYSNLKDLPAEHILEYFDTRVIFHTTTREESERLIERPDASTLDPSYAICFDHGHLEKFRPYALPSREWLTEAAKQISHKDRTM